MKTQVLNLQECEELIKIIRRKHVEGGLSYGWKSNVNNSQDYGHWNKQLLVNSKIFPYDQMKLPMVESYPEIKFIWEAITDSIGERPLLRSYINGYTYGTDAYLHRDDIWIPQMHGKDALSETIIVYLNDEWDANWAGETVIMNDYNEIEASILPKKNRVLIFDSNKLHGARPLSRSCGVLRSVLVFKTIDEKCSSKEVETILELTKNKKHTNRSFFEHLFFTSLLLEKFKQSKDVCLAGLYHSIYGTEFYNANIEISREKVKSIIGNYAEELVNEFCNLEAKSYTLIHNTKNYNQSFRKDLLYIQYANLVEQNFSGRYDNEIFQLEEEISKIK